MQISVTAPINKKTGVVSGRVITVQFWSPKQYNQVVKVSKGTPFIFLQNLPYANRVGIVAFRGL